MKSVLFIFIITFINFKPSFCAPNFDYESDSHNLLVTEESDFDQPEAEYFDYKTCLQVFDSLKWYLDWFGWATHEPPIAVIVLACQFRGHRSEVCNGIIRSLAPQLFHSIQNFEYRKEDFCGIINPGKGPVNPILKSWKIRINSTGVNYDKCQMKNEEISTDFIKVIHLTDIHLDLEYVPGSNKNCQNNGSCCIGPTGFVKETDRAGKYGEPSCSLPSAALDVILQEAEKSSPDIVIVSGDLVSRRIWKYSSEFNSKTIGVALGKIKSAFKNHVQIFPVVGNHETAPIDQFRPSELNHKFDLSWMYEKLLDPFHQNFSADQTETFLKAGFYHASPRKGLRMIFLNTNLCYINNFWIPSYHGDPEGQLQWLALRLQDAENNGEKVWIIGHINPAEATCWYVWSDWFNKIIDRYRCILTAQFYGHSHTGEIGIWVEPGSSKFNPIGVAVTAPGILPDPQNSGWNEYTTDVSGLVMDLKTHMLNTALSNRNLRPQFQVLCDFRKDFGLNSLSPHEVSKLACRMLQKENYQLYRKYHQCRSKDTSNQVPCSAVDKDCIEKEVCRIILLKAPGKCHLFKEYCGLNL